MQAYICIYLRPSEVLGVVESQEAEEIRIAVGTNVSSDC